MAAAHPRRTGQTYRIPCRRGDGGLPLQLRGENVMGAPNTSSSPTKRATWRPAMLHAQD